MQIVIDIDEDDYNGLKRKDGFDDMFLNCYEKAIINGIQLPKSHGRLKDVDWIDDNCENHYSDKDGSWCYTWRDIENAPTTIEADKTESEDEKMNKQEILAEITELKDRLNKLEKMYDSLTLPNKRWSAEIGYSYYYITASGLIESKTEAGLALDNSRYEFGNYFRTEEEAEFEVERLKVIAELKEWTTPVNDFNWNDSLEKKWIIILENGRIKVDHFITCQISDLFFRTMEQAVSAIEAIGEDKIIKYYFRRGEI